MAVNKDVVLSTELNKLKKSELIDLLVYRTLPDGNVSDVLVEFVKEMSDCGSRGCNKRDITSLESVDAVKSKNAAKTDQNDRFPPSETKYLKIVLEQKDVIIDNQRIAIKSLQDHNALLTNLLGMDEKAPNRKNTKPVPSTSSGAEVNLNSGSYKTACAAVTVSEIHAPYSDSDTVVSKTKTSSKVALGNTNHVGADHLIPPNMSSIRDDIGFTGKGRTLRGVPRGGTRPSGQRTMVGSGDDVCGIAAVPSLNYYHVYRLSPTTSVDELQNYLKTSFPEVTCEKLQSRHPDEYSSFKVGISETNIDSFLDPSKWAKGTRINKFFRFTRRRDQEDIRS